MLRRAVLLVVALLVCGCTAAEGLPPLATMTAVPATPETADPGTVPGLATHTGLRDGDVVAVDVDEATRSVLIAVEAAGPDELVGIRRVIAPDGTARYRADLQRQVVSVDDLDHRVVADAGAVGMYLASTPGQPLDVGTWRIEVATNERWMTVRTQQVREAADTPPGQLDLVVWATTDLDATDLGDTAPAAVADAWRSSIDPVLAPHGMSVGALDVIPAGEAGAAHRILGVDGLADDVHDACAQAAAAVGRPGAAHVLLVDRIGEGVLTAAADTPATGRTPADHTAARGHAYRRPDGDIAGFTVSTPGTPVLGPASHGCVAVTAGEDPAGQGLVALHEVLHLAGLTHHTTDADGTRFDRHLDTPECPAATRDLDADGQVSAAECADAGGENLMFWALGGADLSAEQAWRVRWHPLLAM